MHVWGLLLVVVESREFGSIGIKGLDSWAGIDSRLAGCWVRGYGYVGVGVGDRYMYRYRYRYINGEESVATRSGDICSRETEGFIQGGTLSLKN